MSKAETNEHTPRAVPPPEDSQPEPQRLPESERGGQQYVEGRYGHPGSEGQENREFGVRDAHPRPHVSAEDAQRSQPVEQGGQGK